MNIKYITYLLSGLLLFFLFPSCGDNDTTTNYSSSSKDAQIYSFGITAPVPAGKDSTEKSQLAIRFAQVNKTRFAIDQIAGVIYNPDSLPFGTVLDTVKVAITFNPTSSPSKVAITTPDSIKGYSWNLTDSVNVGKLPIKFAVTSQGGTQKLYNIDIRIHKIDPDTILWKKMPSYPGTFGASKTILKSNVFYTYGLKGSTPVLYTADKASGSWVLQTLSGFPATVKPESIFLMNNAFYAVDQAGSSYTSTNGMAWTKLTNGKNVISILGVLPFLAKDIHNQPLVTYTLLVIYKDVDGKYYFGKTKDLITITATGNEVPSNFPLQKAASFTSVVSTDRNKTMLILTGGVNPTGSDLAYTWVIKDLVGGLEMSPFVKNTLFKGAGLSNFVYDNKLYALSSNQFYISTVWGELWSKAPNKQKLDPSISARTDQTVIVDDNNYIWIFGGVSGSTGVSDVWRGRLNSLIP